MTGWGGQTPQKKVGAWGPPNSTCAMTWSPNPADECYGKVFVIIKTFSFINHLKYELKTDTNVTNCILHPKKKKKGGHWSTVLVAVELPEIVAIEVVVTEGEVVADSNG